MKAITGALLLLFVLSQTAFAQEEGEGEMSLEAMMEMMAQMAQPLEDAFLDRLVGDYHGTGSMMEMTTTEETHMEWTLNHHVLRMDVTSTTATPDGTTWDYMGTGYLRPQGDGQYAGVWIDSMGMMASFTAHVEGDTFTSDWSDTSMGNMRRVLTLNADNTSTAVELMQGPDGEWVETGTMSYTR